MSTHPITHDFSASKRDKQDLLARITALEERMSAMEDAVTRPAATGKHVTRTGMACLRLMAQTPTIRMTATDWEHNGEGFSDDTVRNLAHLGLVDFQYTGRGTGSKRSGLYQINEAGMALVEDKS